VSACGWNVMIAAKRVAGSARSRPMAPRTVTGKPGRALREGPGGGAQSDPRSDFSGLLCRRHERTPTRRCPSGRAATSGFQSSCRLHGVAPEPEAAPAAMVRGDAGEAIARLQRFAALGTTARTTSTATRRPFLLDRDSVPPHASQDRNSRHGHGRRAARRTRRR
jgi:hypothetical protein